MSADLRLQLQVLAAWLTALRSLRLPLAIGLAGALLYAVLQPPATNGRMLLMAISLLAALVAMYLDLRLALDAQLLARLAPEIAAAPEALDAALCWVGLRKATGDVRSWAARRQGIWRLCRYYFCALAVQWLALVVLFFLQS